ncbi:MAG: hypothetical protein PHE02_11480 [Lachnospiraceae bacterium]|nr:hypothetical protein [Lachnospiraceae bacterium]
MIDDLTERISWDCLEEAGQLILLLNKQLQIIIPPIASSYLREEMKEVQEDMQYWIQQLDRVMRAIEGNDLFAMVDVLHFETKENLKLYCDMIIKNELSDVL